MNKLDMYNYIKQVLENPTIFQNMTESMFKEIDNDHNGKLEVEELKEFAKGMLSGQLNPQALANLFQELDSDESDALDIDEFSKFVRALFEQQKKMLEVVLSKN